MSPPNSPAAPTLPRARLPTRPVVAKIEAAGGLPHVLDLVVAGETNRAIAARLGVDRGDLARWLSVEGGEQYREALRRSAEGLMDMAEEELRACDALSMASVQKTKMVCEHYYRLAGIRDARYRQNAPAVTITAENTGPAEPPRFEIVIYPQREDLGRLIDHE